MTITIEMKNTLKGINRILDGIEERISDPEDRILEVLGSQNREKESKMVVAKRQGREKPTKIEQRKVKGRSEDQSEDFRQNSTPDEV